MGIYPTLIMTFLYLKAVHIIFIVTWFAGLFYMPRLLVYITEAHQKNGETKEILLHQLKLMAKRLWFGITWPSAIITLGIGAAFLITQPDLLTHRYMHVKLMLVLLLYAYHFSIHYLFKMLEQDIIKYTSMQLRIWNEVSTLFLISIVFIIVLKNSLSMLWGIAGLIAVTILILAGIKLYKNIRGNK